jgi:hypothetical protein
MTTSSESTEKAEESKIPTVVIADAWLINYGPDWVSEDDIRADPFFWSALPILMGRGFLMSQFMLYTNRLHYRLIPYGNS